VQWGLASLKKEGKWGGREKAGRSGGPHLLKRRWGEVGEGGRGGGGGWRGVPRGGARWAMAPARPASGCAVGAKIEEGGSH
jgi:hypothetical protein